MEIHITAPNGQSVTLEALEGFRVMEIIRDWASVSGIGVKAECGGACACATCHVYVDADWADKLHPMQDDEEDRLDEAFNVEPNSRLACQVLVNEALDGLRITLAPEAFLAVEEERAA